VAPEKREHLWRGRPGVHLRRPLGRGLPDRRRLEQRRHTIGLVRGNNWLLRNTNNTGTANLDFFYGNGEFEEGFKVVGDWDGDGDDTPGLVRGNNWLLRNTNNTGTANLDFTYGDPVDGVRIAGDWDGDGDDTPGLVRINNWLLRNSNTTGDAEVDFDYGNGFPSHWPLPGDWDGNGSDTAGVAEPRNVTIAWFFRNENSTGPGTIAFNFM
jgi:hypothetical protein